MRGFRQGDALSCSFFNILLEMIIRAENINTTNIIFSKSNQILGYADDTDLIGRTTTDVRTAFEDLENEAKSRGLHVNGDKGTRRRGRQRTRWVDLVERDARELGIPNWRVTARERNTWKQYCC